MKQGPTYYSMDVFERLLSRISADVSRRDHFVLRGSMLFRQQVDKNRSVKDMDLYIRPEYFDAHNLNSVDALVHEAEILLQLDEIGGISVIDVYSEYFDTTYTVRLTLKQGNNIFSIDFGRDAENLPY